MATGLTPSERRLLQVWVSAPSQKEAAHRLGVTERTFRRRLSEARKRHGMEANHQLLALLVERGNGKAA